MDAFAREAAEIGQDDGIADWSGRLAELKRKVDAFVGELDPHSEREEGTLFPLMARYIGRQTGPIAVMEYEHDLAKTNLKRFREAVERLEGAVDAERAKEIASCAIQAHAVLTEHFMKEENVLFPMAENMLNEEGTRPRRRIGLNRCSRFQAALQPVPQHGRVVVNGIFRGVDERDGPFEGRFANAIREREADRIFRQFPFIAADKFLKSLRLVSEPGAQFGTRGDFFHPFVDGRLRFRNTARPETVDEHAQAVFGGGRLVDSFDADGGPVCVGHELSAFLRGGFVCLILL